MISASDGVNRTPGGLVSAYSITSSSSSSPAASQAQAVGSAAVATCGCSVDRSWSSVPAAAAVLASLLGLGLDFMALPGGRTRRRPLADLAAAPGGGNKSES